MINSRKIFIEKQRFYSYKAIWGQHYSTDKDKEDFYLWAERILVPVRLYNNDFYCRRVKEEVYKCLNDEKYHAYTGSLNNYLSNSCFTIEDCCKIEQQFKRNLILANSLGKEKILEYYHKKETIDFFLPTKE